MKTTEHTANTNADDTAEGADQDKPEERPRNKTKRNQSSKNNPQAASGRDPTAVTQFDFRGHLVRSVMRGGQPWFIARDVCDVLEHSNSRMAVSGLDADEKGISIVDTPGGAQELGGVNESGLYKLVFTSRKHEAKAFRRWVTSKVLPAIRKTGRYQADQAAGAQTVPIELPNTGRFIVTMTADGPHIQETAYAAILDEAAIINGTILAHAMGVIACYWHMVQQFQCYKVDHGEGFAMERLKKAICEGDRLGRRYLEIWNSDWEERDTVKH